ncbi:MAG: IS110 family transposase [Coriobacteriaceae bacterium]|nr:MAG: IS110 family transposase [Coriobacteriaceae bacterium]
MSKGIALTDSELEGKVVAGVDTHADTHWLCVLDERRRVALSREFPATPDGYEALADAIGDPALCAAVGVEGTCSYGAGLTDALTARGFRVLEVLSKKKDRRRRRGEGKDDGIDAERAARDVLAADGTSVPKLRGGWVDELRSLLVARERCVSCAVEAHAAALSLARTAPEEVRRRWEGMSQERMMGAALGIEEGAASALERALLALARMWKAARDEADALESLMRRVLEERCPSLLAIYCLGTVGASELAVAAGENPGRLRSEAAFAMLCGTSPIPASSGKTSGRMRLNRGGDRRANKALHTVAVRRMRYDPRTRDYVERRMSGRRALSKAEAIRCVKRYIAREVYHALMHPKDVGERVDRLSLRKARKSAGLSQTEAAHALGVSPSTVSGFENGRCESRMLAERYSAWVLEGMPMGVENPESDS